MEENLLKLFKIADKLNEKQNEVYAEINYCAYDSKRLEISIRKKKDFTYVEKCEIRLANSSIKNWNSIIELFESYVGGIGNE